MGCRPCSSRVPNMKRNHMDYVYMDFEFIPWILGRDSRNNVDRGILSVGIVTKHAAYYAINAEMDWQTAFVTGRTARWMTENVFRHYPGTHPRLDHGHEDVKPYAQIGAEVDAFFKAACPTGSDKKDIEVVVNCGAQDMIRMHTLVCDNDWSDINPWIPQSQDDIGRITRKANRLGLKKEELPVQLPETLHHGLYDAEYEREVHTYIRSRLGDI